MAVSNAQCASRLLNSGKVKKMIAEYDPPTGTLEAKREDISRDYALARLQNTYDKAETAKDITNMVACVRLMMQHTGCLDQTLVVDIQDSRKLEEGHREASRKIANAIVSGDMLPEFNPDHAGTHRLVDGFNAVSAQFEEPPPAAEEAIIPDEISPDDFLSDD